jgi:tripartite-type tricarboxylate transporter receptor subunit TctC
MVIGYSVGGGYDLYGRLVARYLGRHIPGQPTIVPQNREGAGSMRAAIYIYNAAPKDGTVIGTFSRSMAVAPLLQEAPFDASKFSWLGSVSTDVNVCMTWHTSPVKTWDDMLTKPAKIGGLGAGADPDIFALMFKNVFGAKFQLVSGYPGTNDVALAMERGEVDGICGLSWSTVKTRHGDWLAGKKVNIPVQAGLHKENDIADVPLVMDLVKTPEQTQIVRLILASQEMARPFAAPPGIPEDRRRALVAAFDETMKDPDFLAEAAKMKADVNPVSAAAIESLLADVYKTPKDVIAKAAKATSNTQ